jgi:ABC-2 type transport system permease protein
MLGNLFLKTWRDHWRGFVGWSLGLVAIVSVQLAVYPTVRKSSADLSAYMQNFPPALQKIFRMQDYASGAGYISTELLSFMIPFIFVSVGASWGANSTALEEERGTSDFLLSMPISRTHIVLSKLSAAVLAQILLAVVVGASVIIGRHSVDLVANDSYIIASVLVCALLGLLFLGLALLIGVSTGKKTLALGGTIAVALASFLFYSLAPLVDTFDSMLAANPFQWTLGSDPMHRGFDMWHILLTLGVACALYIASVLIYERRDLAA